MEDVNDAMEVPILNLTNYEIHPTDSSFMVYHFSQEASADYFEDLLKQHDLYYERDRTDNKRKTFLFGVRRRDYKKIAELNNLTIGNFRQPTITNKYLGLGILLVTGLILLLAVVGYFVSK